METSLVPAVENEGETKSPGVAERCRQSWAAYEAAAREAGERADASWRAMEQEAAIVGDRAR